MRNALTTFVILLLLNLTAFNAFAGVSDPICGVDRDNSGTIDLLCPAGDLDRDGVADSVDCAPTDPYIYSWEGVVGSNAGCTTNNAKVCNSDGTYGACSTTGFCPADALHCYYVDTVNGSDVPGTGVGQGNGSFAHPWKSQKMFSSYYTPGDRPAGWHDTVEGDNFVFFGGTYNQQSSFNGQLTWFAANTLAGTTAHPIRLLCSPGATCIMSIANNTAAFQSYISDHVEIAGFTAVNLNVLGGNLAGATAVIGFAGGTGDQAYNNHISGTYGITGNNLAGLYAHSTTDAIFHHNRVSDTVGTVADNANNTNMVGFRNFNITIFQNDFLFATQNQNTNMRVEKHAEYAGSSTIYDNVFVRGQFATGAGNLNFHDNLLFDIVQSINFRDQGGPTHLRNILIDHNTFQYSDFGGHVIQAGYDASNSPTGSACVGAAGDLTNIVSTNNVVVDDAPSYFTDTRLVVINNYMPDPLYTALVTNGGLVYNNNCYYNPLTTISFDVFTANDGSAGCAGRGNLGAAVNFAQWQALGFDAGTYVEPITIDSGGVATSTHCNGRGLRLLSNPGPGPSAVTSRGRSLGRFK